jgi:hypothetical protein
MKQNFNYAEGNGVVLPDEIWRKYLELSPQYPIAITISVRLFSGEMVPFLLVSERGTVLGKIADGLAGAHGAIDDSVLTFCTEDIEAVRILVGRCWPRAKWVTVNPQHSAHSEEASIRGGGQIYRSPSGKEFKGGKHVVLPDDVWCSLLRLFPRSFLKSTVYVRLISGEILHQMVISDRGVVLGRKIDNGQLDNSMLTFGTRDIEAIQVPAVHFWQRPRWFVVKNLTRQPTALTEKTGLQ